MTVKSNHIRVLRALAVAILSFASCLVTSAQVSLRGQMTVEQAILQIQKETDYSFFYNSTDLIGIGSRNINVSGAIETVLESLFLEQQSHGVSRTRKSCSRKISASRRKTMTNAR